MSPPISEHMHTVALNRKRWGGVCQDCVHTARTSWSFAVDRVTASFGSCLLLYCAVLLFILRWFPVPGVYLESLIQFVCGVADNRRTVSMDCRRDGVW